MSVFSKLRINILLRWGSVGRLKVGGIKDENEYACCVCLPSGYNSAGSIQDRLRIYLTTRSSYACSEVLGCNFRFLIFSDCCLFWAYQKRAPFGWYIRPMRLSPAWFVLIARYIANYGRPIPIGILLSSLTTWTEDKSSKRLSGYCQRVVLWAIS